MSSTYALKVVGYCGMTIPLSRGLSYPDAREEARRFLQKMRREFHYNVNRLSPHEWEIECADDALVSDFNGFLLIRKEGR